MSRGMKWFIGIMCVVMCLTVITGIINVVAYEKVNSLPDLGDLMNNPTGGTEPENSDANEEESPEEVKCTQRVVFSFENGTMTANFQHECACGESTYLKSVCTTKEQALAILEVSHGNYFLLNGEQQESIEEDEIKRMIYIYSFTNS